MLKQDFESIVFNKLKPEYDKIDNQGQELVLEYFRGQLTETLPAVFIFYEHEDYEDPVPIVHAHLITDQEKQDLFSAVNGAKDIEILEQKFTKNPNLIDYDIGKRFENFFVIQQYSIIELDKIWSPAITKQGRKHRYEYVKK